MSKITYIKGVFVDFRSFETNLKWFEGHLKIFQKFKMADVISWNYLFADFPPLFGYGPSMNSQKTNANWQSNYIKVVFVDFKSFKINLKQFVRYLDNFQKYKMAAMISWHYLLADVLSLFVHWAVVKRCIEHLFAALSR